MSTLPTREDLLRRKAIERDELDRPNRWAAFEQRELAEARARYWTLLEEFVARAQELGLRPVQRESPLRGHPAERIAWVEGYPLTGGHIVSAPPCRYCSEERRRVLRPETQVREVDELTMFVLSTGDGTGLGAGLVEQHGVSRGSRPAVSRLDQTAALLTALQRELEASLLALMD